MYQHTVTDVCLRWPITDRIVLDTEIWMLPQPDDQARVREPARASVRFAMHSGRAITVNQGACSVCSCQADRTWHICSVGRKKYSDQLVDSSTTAGDLLRRLLETLYSIPKIPVSPRQLVPRAPSNKGCYGSARRGNCN